MPDQVPVPAPAYAPGVMVEVEGPPKRPAQTERLLYSLRAWNDLSPLVFIGTSDGTLRSYVADGRAGFLRWHADYKRLFHACCMFLDDWGVFATIADNRVKLVDLPLQNQKLDGSGRDDTKGAVLFAAHQEAKTMCVLLKTNTLKVFDWTVNRILEPRAQHELQTTLLPVQQLVMLSESHVFIQGKKSWVVLNVDSGRALSVAPDVMQQVNDALEGSVGVLILTIEGETKVDEENNDVYGAFDDDMDRYDESARKTLDVSSHLCVKVERKIAYNKAPRGVFYHHPFLLLDQAEQIAVYNFGSLQMVQTLPVKNPYDVCAVINVVSVDQYSNIPQFGSDQPPTLFTVSPPFDVQTHQMISVAQQVATSLGNRRLEDAVALCKLCPSESPLNDADQRNLYANYGFELFRSARRQEAMDFFFESEIDVMEVLMLFPRNLLPRKASALRKDSSNSNKDHHLEGDDLVESLLALIAFLRRKRNAYLHYEDELPSMGIRVHHNLGPNEEKALELIDTMLVKCLVVVAEKAKYEDRAKRALFDVVTCKNWCEI
ncbi:Hypothetical protein PHPALM_12425, partial [Phytophthora palmivora]